MSMLDQTLLRMADEARANELTLRAARRLSEWSVRWWVMNGVWPDEDARQAQMLAGWPRGHRGHWPEFGRPRTTAEVVRLVDKKEGDMS